MKTTMKVWAGLGLATALVGGGVAGCADDAVNETEATGTAQTGEAGEGEGGESGEGGVSVAHASTDPVVYGSALAVAEAHAIAALDAFKAGKLDPATEMFGHPVGEVLADMEPVFEERGVDDFKQLFFDASTAVAEGKDEAEVTQHYDDIISALRSAAEKAPDNGSSEAAVAAGITADMIERAISMYGEASGTDRYEPYLDGYGFFKTAETSFDGSSDAIKAENDTLHTRLTEALELLSQAYASVERPAELDANQGQLQAAGSSVQLSLPQS